MSTTPSAPPPPHHPGARPGPPQAPPPPVGRALAVHRPGAPPRVLLAVTATGLVAALISGADRPGIGVLVLAGVVAAVVGVVRTPAQPRSRWQGVHTTTAVLLAAGAAVRDAQWLVALDLVAAALVGALSLAPAGTWSAVLLAPLRPLAQVGRAVTWLARGLRRATLPARERIRSRRRAAAGAAAGAPGRRWRRLAPALRGTALTVVLLAVFVPLLTSADPRFAALLAHALDGVATGLDALARLPGPDRLGELIVRTIVFAVSAVATGAGLVVAWDARHGVAPTGRVARAAARRPTLARTVEWLLPLAALDGLFAAFLLVRVLDAGDSSATFAEQLHAGFTQLVLATALVLGVVALATRWTSMSTGPRAALAVLCVLALGLDAVALSALHTYVAAYGLTRLRLCVAVTCAGLAALLLLLLVAGALHRDRGRLRRTRPWVPHTAVLVAAACLLGLTAIDPDADIARSQLSRPASATRTPSLDASYLRTLSADAVPALAAALDADPTALGAGGPCLVADVAGVRSPATRTSWAAANASRARAHRIAADLPRCAAHDS